MKNAVGREIPEEILRQQEKKYFTECIIMMVMNIRKMDPENPLRGEFRWQQIGENNS